jgi:hypothetical protein
MPNTNRERSTEMTAVQAKECKAHQSSWHLSRPLKAAVWAVAAAGGFFLLRENWSPISGNWIYLLLLACPLMHFFHGHGGHTKQAYIREE